VLKLVMDLSTILLVIVLVVLKIWMKAESSHQVRPGSTAAFWLWPVTYGWAHWYKSADPARHCITCQSVEQCIADFYALALSSLNNEDGGGGEREREMHTCRPRTSLDDCPSSRGRAPT
jgi:hypothetical protein